MTAGSSGIMIDALGWHLGLLLLFGSCLDKQIQKSSHTGGNKRLTAGKHQSLLSQKSEGTGYVCFSTAGRVLNRTKREKETPAYQIIFYRVTISTHSSASSL